MSERNFDHIVSALSVHLPDINASRQAVVGEIAAAIGRNDFPAVAEHLTEQVELRITGFPLFDGAWQGRAAVIGAMAANFTSIAEQVTELEALIQQGDSIATLIRERGRLKPDGQPYKVRGVMWWTFEGDRVARVEEFLGSVA